MDKTDSLSVIINPLCLSVLYWEKHIYLHLAECHHLYQSSLQYPSFFSSDLLG